MATKSSNWKRHSPFFQNLLVAAQLFCYPGLYLAITNLGAGGGKADSITAADTSNGVLYGVFTFSALLGASTINVFGPRVAALIGSIGYPMFIGSFWYFDKTANIWFPIFAGAVLGFAAGHLWTLAGFMCNCYAQEHQKGTWRAIQWVFNASGATVGALIAFAINLHSQEAEVPQSVYITFIVIQLLAFVFAVLIVPSESLVRSDGTHVTTHGQASMKQSLKTLAEACRDWRVLIMIPTFFAGEVSLILQSSMNAYAYNLRTRSLNGVLNPLGQIPWVVGLGYLLDCERLGGRRKRGLIGIAATATLILGTYVAQLVWLSSWKFDRSIPGPNIDWTDDSYAGAVVIYILYGAQYGLLENLVIWVLGTLTNNKEKLASLSGLFVSVQSAGVAVAFGIDASSVPYINESAAYFALAAITFPILVVVCWTTTEINYTIEADVEVPQHAIERFHLDQKHDLAQISTPNPVGS